MRVFPILLAAILVLVLIIPAVPVDATSDPVRSYHWTKHIANHDAYVWIATGDTNYGSSVALYVVGNDKKAYMSWNLTGITGGATITEVCLYVYKQTDTTFDEDYVKVMPVSAWWNESAITWNNKPAMIYENDPLMEFDTDNDLGWVNGTSASFASTMAAQYASTGRCSIGLNWSSWNEHTKGYVSSEDTTDSGYYRPHLWIRWYTEIPPPVTWTYRLEPVADAEVREQNPNDNYGDWDMLAVQSSYTHARESYFRFDLSSLPYMANITEASLHLFNRGDSTADGMMTLASYYPPEEWAEDEITWQTRPVQGVHPILTFDDSENIGWVVCQDLLFTENVQDQYNATEKVYLYISDDSWYAPGTKYYYSKEGPAGFHPYLEITFWTTATQYEQPGTGEYDPGTFWTPGGLSNWVISMMGIIGFLGMIAPFPLLILWFKSGDYDNPVVPVANAAALWVVSFVFFWGSLAL